MNDQSTLEEEFKYVKEHLGNRASNLSRESISFVTNNFSLEVYCKGRLFGYRLTPLSDETAYLLKDTDNYRGQDLVESAKEILREIEHIIDALQQGRISYKVIVKKRLLRKKEVKQIILPNYEDKIVQFSAPAINNFFFD